MRRQDGFVSLFTCIMISLLLLVITVSLISLETLQLRKAEDAEQTLRAYYTAEAGVEDAVSKVLSGAVTTDQPCVTKTPIYDAPGAANWTCQQISFSGTPFGKLETPDTSKTVDPGSVNYNSVIVEWNQSANINAGFYNANVAGGFPDTAGWSYAAPLELSIVEYPRGGFAAGDPGLKLQNVVIVPGGSGAPGLINYSGATFKTGSPYRGNCSALPRVTPFGASSYNCYAVLSGFTGPKDFIFRLRSRYTASAYKLTFKTGANGGGATVQVPDGTATIDVTAKAGQTYRRVISKLPLNGSAAGGLNYVMYSDTNICKNFDVIDNVAQPGCPY